MNLINIHLTIETDSKISSLKKTINLYKKYIRRRKEEYNKKIQKLNKKIRKLESKTFLPVGVEYINGNYIKKYSYKKMRIVPLNLYPVIKGNGFDKKETYKIIKKIIGFEDFKIMSIYATLDYYLDIYEAIIYSNKFRKKDHKEGMKISYITMIKNVKKENGKIIEISKIAEEELE